MARKTEVKVPYTIEHQETKDVAGKAEFIINNMIDNGDLRAYLVALQDSIAGRVRISNGEDDYDNWSFLADMLEGAERLGYTIRFNAGEDD